MQSEMPPQGVLDASKLKAGDVLSRISYMRVIGMDGDSVEVENESGFRWSIARSILEAEAVSSSQYTKTLVVPRTELARVLEQDVRDTVFSVAFTKLPDLSEQEKTLADADLSTPAKRRKFAKILGVGKERVLHGHIDDPGHELGRMPVIDLEVTSGSKERLVDLRTLKWLVFGGVKYEVK